MMNPLLFGDWNRIQRMFRRTMWLVAMVLACVIWAAAAFRAQRAHGAHPPPHSTLTHLTLHR